MLSATVALLCLVACDIRLQNDQLGVTIAEIVRVRGSLGEDDDEVVWRVRSTGDDSVGGFVVGVEGEAYEEDVPLAEPLRGGYNKCA